MGPVIHESNIPASAVWVRRSGFNWMFLFTLWTSLNNNEEQKHTKTLDSTRTDVLTPGDSTRTDVV